MVTPVINERLHFFAYYPMRAASILFQQPLFSSSSFPVRQQERRRFVIKESQWATELYNMN
jgi:hypothetical protein